MTFLALTLVLIAAVLHAVWKESESPRQLRAAAFIVAGIVLLALG